MLAGFELSLPARGYVLGDPDKPMWGLMPIGAGRTLTPYPARNAVRTQDAEFFIELPSGHSFVELAKHAFTVLRVNDLSVGEGVCQKLRARISRDGFV